MERPEWHADAACRGMLDVFFAARDDTKRQREAKNICATCPVVAPCQEAGLMEKFGTWGGESERQRYGKRRTLGVVVAAEIDHGTVPGYNAHRRRAEVPCRACKDAYNRYQNGRKTALRLIGGAA